MTINAAMDAYCRAVGTALDLPKPRKQALLDGLRLELEDRFSPAEDMDPETLYRELGTPRETAEALLESVPQKERDAYRAKKKRRSRWTVAVLAIVAALALVCVGYLWHNGGLVVIETTHYTDGTMPDMPADGEHVVRYHYNQEG